MTSYVAGEPRQVHTICFLTKVRVMPAGHDPELRSETVRLRVEHRDDHLGQLEALTAVDFPDSDFLLFDAAYGRVLSRALPPGGQR